MDKSDRKQLRRFRREIREIAGAARESGSDPTAELGRVLEKASKTTVYLQVKDCVGLALVAHQSRRSSPAPVSPSPVVTSVAEPEREPVTESATV